MPDLLAGEEEDDDTDPWGEDELRVAPRKPQDGR